MSSECARPLLRSTADVIASDSGVPSSGCRHCSLVSSLEASLCPAHLSLPPARLCLCSACSEARSPPHTHLLVFSLLWEGVGHVCKGPLAPTPQRVPGKCVGRGWATPTCQEAVREQSWCEGLGLARLSPPEP